MGPVLETNQTPVGSDKRKLSVGSDMGPNNIVLALAVSEN